MSRDIDLEELRAELKGTRPGVFWSDGVACDHGRTKRDCEWCTPRPAMNNVITSRDLTDFVIRSLDGREAEFDVQGIVDTIQREHGTNDADAVPDDAYWKIVARHDRHASPADDERHCGSPEGHRAHTWSDYGVDTPCPGGPSDTSRLHPR